MRVLRVVTSMDPQAGGVVEAIHQTAKALNADKWKMDVLCFDDKNAPWVNRTQNYNIYALGKGISSYCINFKYFSWLLKYSRNYDVVILDGLWQFHMWGGYFLTLLKIPYCVFTHGMLDPYFNNNKLKYIKKLPFWFFVERNIIANAKATIFTCQEESELAATSFPFYRATPEIASLGVESENQPSEFLSTLFYDEFPELQHTKFALFLSRIHEKKGIDLLIEALSQIEDLPSDFALAIAGPDSMGLKAKLVKQITALGLSKRVYWLDMLAGDIKWGAYHAASVFVLPSHQENFGIVVAEALSTSTPVLITNKVNIWREIESNNCGFVENDNITGVKALMRKWLKLTITEKEVMGEKAKACYQYHFSSESAAAALENVLNEVSNR
jgi:glycosyltransferase involved in cell wall biosynthesis